MAYMLAKWLTALRFISANKYPTRGPFKTKRVICRLSYQREVEDTGP